MKKLLYTILRASIVISTIGMIMDSDIKETSVLLRLFECVMMTTTIFIVLSLVYYAIRCVKQRLQNPNEIQ